MIGIELSKARKMFLDSAAVHRMIDQRTKRVLSRFGSFVRSTARESIKRRKEPSKPGEPPHTRTGLLKKILFIYDPIRRSVVVGPMKLNTATQSALPALEYGGESIAKVGPGRKLKKRIIIRKRPFMQPALEKELPKLPGLWANSVK